MILIGLAVLPDSKMPVAAVIQKRFRHLKHQYAVIGWHRWRPEEAVDGLRRLAANRSLAEPKRIYRQDRRPRKTVREAPGIIADASGCRRWIGELRSGGLAVERVLVDGEMIGWQCTSTGRGRGADFRVSPENVLGAFSTIRAEGRLTVASQATDAETLRQSLTDWQPTDRWVSAEPLLPVMLPLWFREAVPYRRRYTAT